MGTALAKPAALTKDVQREIIRALAEGNYVKVACEGAGITYQGFRYWQKRWEEGDPEVYLYDDFFASVKRAVAVGEQVALAKVRTGDVGWQGSAWFLERRFPARWGQKSKVQVEGADVDLSNMSTEDLVALAKGKGRRGA